MRVLNLASAALILGSAAAFMPAAVPRRGDAQMILGGLNIPGLSSKPAAPKASPAPINKKVVSSAKKATPVTPSVTVGAGEYVPDGLTRAQWAAIKGEEAAKKAQKKEKPAKIETLEEWQEEFENGKTGHRFAKMKFDDWYVADRYGKKKN